MSEQPVAYPGADEEFVRFFQRARYSTPSPLYVRGKDHGWYIDVKRFGDEYRRRTKRRSRS